MREPTREHRRSGAVGGSLIAAGTSRRRSRRRSHSASIFVPGGRHSRCPSLRSGLRVGLLFFPMAEVS